MSGPQSEGFKELDSDSYDLHSDAYGRHIQQLAAPVVAELCARTPLFPGQRVLDVGTGTGVGARAAAHLVGRTGSVLGVDLSPGMVMTADATPAPDNAAPLEYRVGDAEALELDDGSFDAVVSLFAALHFPNPAAGVAEMRRVVKPGGRVMVAIGAPRPAPGPGLVKHVVRRLAAEAMALRRPRMRAPARIVEMARDAVPDPPEQVLSEWDSTGQPSTLVAAAKSAGLTGLTSGWVGNEVRYATAEEFWDAQLAIVTEARKRLHQAAPEVTERLHRTFVTEANDVLARGGQLIYPHGAFYVCGERPVAG